MGTAEEKNGDGGYEVNSYEILEEALENKLQEYNQTVTALRQAVNTLKTAEAVVEELTTAFNRQTEEIRDIARAQLMMEEEAIPLSDDVMPVVDGKSFRCDCRCNVFKRIIGTQVYVCNACGARYHGEA